MKMKTLTVNGQSFQVIDEGAVRYDEAQTLTDQQKAQVRKTIGAMESGKADSALNMNGYHIYRAESVTIQKSTEQAEDSPYVQLFVDGTVDTEEGEARSILGFDSLVGGNTVVRYVHAGIQDNDAATVGQLKAALQEKQEQLDKLASHGVYKNLYGRVEITAEDVAAAGDEGITCVTIGSEDVDLSEYHDILFKIVIPTDENLNTDEYLLCISATGEETYTGDAATFLLRPQSSNISTACRILPNRNSCFAVNAMFTGDEFLYGQVMKNGYSNSYCYPGVQNAWTCIDDRFVKSQKKFFHITGQKSTSFVFKFPVGTYAEVYGR